jgi:hypothetical protein
MYSAPFPNRFSTGRFSSKACAKIQPFSIPANIFSRQGPARSLTALVYNALKRKKISQSMHDPASIRPGSAPGTHVSERFRHPFHPNYVDKWAVDCIIAIYTLKPCNNRLSLIFTWTPLPGLFGILRCNGQKLGYFIGDVL